MVLDKLRDGLQGAFVNLRKAVVVDKKTVKTFIKDIQKTLISSDVNVELVFKLSSTIEERGLLEKPPGGLSRKENLIKLTYEQLVDLLGAGGKVSLGDKQRILLVGTQGSGKTTTAAKLARHVKKRGLNPKLICADTFRPAAYDQLKQLSAKIDVPFYGDPGEKNSLSIIKRGLREFKDEGVIIIDSEGRHKLNDDLMEEIRGVYSEIKPDKTLLVLDATIGQQAGEQAKAFEQHSKVDGVILTKLDGSAKGGGAISACAATGAPVYYVGVGEHLEDFEEFDAERFVSRLIGFGDMQGLLERAREADFDEEAAKRMMSGKFTLNEVYTQIEQVSQMGSMKKLLELMPFQAKIPKDMLQIQEDKMKGWKIIMDSMTDEEKTNPPIIKRNRVERIAAGSGSKPEDVRELLTYYKRMKKMMKSVGDERKLRRLMKRMGSNFGM
ncbi:MAG: signal recognition particle protein [Candidatus Altiarchaeales archaeon ex4484_96]|nr:MAG: signal recognition particle protein [Candidatus Altiarchaeales archaeon ex4484_96]